MRAHKQGERGGGEKAKERRERVRGGSMKGTEKGKTGNLTNSDFLFLCVCVCVCAFVLMVSYAVNIQCRQKF